MRRPRKSPLELYLREAEKTIAGALFVELSPEQPQMKAALRSYFVALVAFELVGICGSTAQMRAVLSASQTTGFEELSAYASTRETTFELRVKWALNQMYRSLSPAPIVDIEALTEKLYLWTRLAIQHVRDSLRHEPPPDEVNWGRRELAFREVLSRLGEGAQYRVDLALGKVFFQHRGEAKKSSDFQVLGRFDSSDGSYLAGWAIPGLEDMLRPLPVMGCFSQLSRVNASDALAEAKRCAWLAKLEYILEHPISASVYYLGLKPAQSVIAKSAFDEDDIRPEVLAQLRELKTSLESRSAKRVKDLFRSHSETLRRRLSLFPPSDPLAAQIAKTAASLEEMGQTISTQTLLGGARNKVRSSQIKECTKRITKLQKAWSG